jgi:formate hydrogenlyase subunit 4
MVLDHSGPALGMILYGAALKLFVLGAVTIRVLMPWDSGNAWLDWGGAIVGMLLVAVLIGVVESTMARLRLVNIPKVLVAACLLSAFGIILLVK